MIKSETMQRLENAGLKPDKKILIGGGVNPYIPVKTFLLDQLLQEIEELGYVWDLNTNWDAEYKIESYDCYIKNNNMLFRGFNAESINEATAQALLWLKEDSNRD